MARNVRLRPLHPRWIGVAVVLSGCAQSREFAPDAGSRASTVAFDAHRDALIGQLCDRLLACPIPNGTLLDVRAALRTHERCVNYESEWYARAAWTTNLRDSIARGRILFDAQQAAACVAMETTCGERRYDDLDPCRHIYIGTIPVGGECDRRFECAPSSYCLGVNGSCPGTCTPLTPLGGTCESTDECANDRWGYGECDTSVTPSVCFVRDVRLDAALGESCGIQPDGTRVACEGKLWCDRPLNDVGICRQPLALHSPNANANAPCEGWAIRDDQTNTCEALTLVDEVGAECDATSGIAGTRCDPLANLICLRGACSLAGDGSEGSLCAVSMLDDVACKADFYCDSATSQCTRRKDAGASCSRDIECVFTCNFDTGVCTDRYCGL